jgi:hypothetical protein
MKVQVGSYALATALAIALTPALAARDGKPVKLEDIPGSPAKRITLTEKAAQRLGIKTAKVSEELIVRKQMVGGLVIAPSQIRQPEPQPADRGFGGFGRSVSSTALQPIAAAATSAPPTKETWVLLALSHAEWERLAKDKPARLLPLATREPLGKEIVARPAGMAPIEDSKRSMLSLYYVVSGTDHGLEPNKRMRVELQLDGSDEKRKVVPYSAVYYDAKGAAWLYVNPEPLVFHRQRIGVERIAGDWAVLSDGPPVGTTVVTVGAPLLYGTEIFKK